MDTSHVSGGADVNLAAAGRSRLNSTGLGADFQDYVTHDPNKLD